MRLRYLNRGEVWTVAAVADDRPDPKPNFSEYPDCELINFFRTLEGTKLKAGKTKFWMQLKSFVDCSEMPHEILGKEAVHAAYNTKIEGIKVVIWEFVSADIRVLFFYDEKSLVICTHGFVKKSNQTPKVEQEKAIRIWTEYQQQKTRDAHEKQP